MTQCSLDLAERTVDLVNAPVHLPWTAALLEWPSRNQVWVHDAVPSFATQTSTCLQMFLQEVIDDLISSVLSHVSKRPSQAVVDLELAEWRAGQPAALAAISRHLADG
jgi:hypothetical protein